VCDLFQGLIGVLHWICEFDWIDVAVDVAMLTRFLAAPRSGHLDRVSNIFADLKWLNWSSVVFDDAGPSLTCSWLCDWDDHCSGVYKAVLPDAAPDVRGNWLCDLLR
jgi:hypothetical protein